MKKKCLEDDASKCGGILTPWLFYAEAKQKSPGALILMRHYDAFYVFGEDAVRVEPILSSVLTHKDAGKMYCYGVNDYNHAQFSFGVHNLDKVLPALISANMRVIVTNYNNAFKECGGWKRAERMIAGAEQKRKEQRNNVWVQLSLLDVDGFL